MTSRCASKCLCSCLVCVTDRHTADRQPHVFRRAHASHRATQHTHSVGWIVFMTFELKFIRSFKVISTLIFMLMSAPHTSNQIFESEILSFCLETNARLSGGEVFY